MSKRDEKYEELNNQLERLSDTVENATYQIPDTFHHSVRVDTDLDFSELADAIKFGAAAGLAGVVLGGLFSIKAAMANVAGAMVEFLLERLEETRKKTQLINSILWLQEKHPYLTFRFIMERASVKGASEQELKAIINELLHEDILVEYRHKNKRALMIDPEGKELQAYWDWLEELRESLSK